MTITGKTFVAQLNTSPDGLPRKTSGFRRALPQIIAVMAKNVLLMAYGMTIGYTTILIPGLSGNDPNETFHLNEEQISWISSINMMCVPLGCVFSGVATQPIGRRRAMQVITFPFIMCWLIFKFATEIWHVYLALALTGLFGGIVEAPVLTYVAEITQPHLRGMLSATSSLAVILGILIQFLLGTFLDWRTMALVSCSLPIASFCLLCFMPESPYWLVMNNKMDKARKSLAWLRGWTDVQEIEPEFQEICRSQKLKEAGIDNPTFEDEATAAENNTKAKSSFKSFLRQKIKNARNFSKKNFLWPFALVSFVYFLVSFTGSSTLQTYAVKIFQAFQVPIDKYYATVLLGVAELVGSIISVILVRSAGKRVMAFISISGTGVCTIIVATYAYLVDIRSFDIKDHPVDVSVGPSQEIYKWVPLVFLILLAFISHCGMRVLPWILIGEVYSHETRATGCGLSGAVSYVFSFFANKVFLRMVAFLTFPGVYWFYGGLSFFGLILLYFTLPETEGKTLEEITNHFDGLSKLGNKVTRKTKKKNLNGTVNQAFDNKPNEINQNVDFESKL